MDFGTRRIGLAVSDPSATIATPLETVSRRAGKRPPLARIAAIGREHEVGHIVVGLPLDLQGNENDWCAEVRTMATGLSERLEVDVSFVDERLTSVRAERTIQAMGLKKSDRQQKERVDAIAAQLILQSWLDAQGRTP